MIFASASLVFISFFAPPETGVFHAVLVGDTRSNLTDEVESNLQLMERMSVATAKSLHLRPHLIRLKDQNADPAQVSAALQELIVGPNDRILFYFSGHGARLEHDFSPYPSLYFTNSDSLTPFNAVLTQLAQKNARFALAMADCCNIDVEEYAVEPTPPEIDYPAVLKTPLKYDQSKLFATGRGLLALTAAKPGERSWVIPEGGLFTLAFLQSDRDKGLIPSWQEMNRATCQIQTAQCAYDLGYL